MGPISQKTNERKIETKNVQKLNYLLDINMDWFTEEAVGMYQKSTV